MSTTAIPPPGSQRLPRMDHATVADVMQHGVHTCAPEAGLVEVARIMATHHVHSVVVMGVERTLVGERLTWGLVSDLDLVAAASAGRVTADAAAVAHTRVVTVTPSDSLETAAALMHDHRVAHLIVVDPHTLRPTGVLSTLDIAGALAWGEA